MVVRPDDLPLSDLRKIIRIVDQDVRQGVMGLRQNLSDTQAALACAVSEIDLLKHRVTYLEALMHRREVHSQLLPYPHPTLRTCADCDTTPLEILGLPVRSDPGG